MGWVLEQDATAAVSNDEDLDLDHNFWDEGPLAARDGAEMDSGGPDSTHPDSRISAQG